MDEQQNQQYQQYVSNQNPGQEFQPQQYQQPAEQPFSQPYQAPQQEKQPQYQQQPQQYQPPQQQQYQPPQQQYQQYPQTNAPVGNGLAIGSLICAIASFFIFGIPLGIVAIALGMAYKRKGGTSKLATAGIVVGIVGIVLAIISVAVLGASGISNFSS